VRNSVTLPYDFSRGRLLVAYKGLAVQPGEEIVFSGEAPEDMVDEHTPTLLCGMPWVKKSGVPTLTVKRKERHEDDDCIIGGS
jgi:hypothetical protein